MITREALSPMFFSIVIFFSIISLTTQLFCSTNCSIIQVKHSDPFVEPSQHASCLNDTSVNLCKGRIIAYYDGENYPRYINYTFGIIGDVLERKYENNINEFALANLTKYQVIVNATSRETRMIADIYCTTDDQCALREMKNLFNKYNHQINPFYALKSFVYSDSPSKRLYCYDMSAERSKQCEMTTNTNPACISYLSDLKQECSWEIDLGIHEEFVLTSPYEIQLNLMNELVKCNKDNCNHNDILAKIQKIARDYAYGTVWQTNNARRERTGIYQIVCLCIFIACFLFK